MCGRVLVRRNCDPNEGEFYCSPACRKQVFSSLNKMQMCLVENILRDDVLSVDKRFKWQRKAYRKKVDGRFSIKKQCVNRFYWSTHFKNFWFNLPLLGYLFPEI